jgi:hypothetical protein
VNEAEKATITLKLEVDPNAAPPAATAAPKPGEPPPASSAAGANLGGGASVGGSTPPPQADLGAGGSSGMKIAAFSAFGVGAVGVGLGTVFLLKSLSNRSKADDLCHVGNTTSCPKELKPQIDQYDADATSAQTIAIVGYAVGGASVLTGILLLALDKGSNASVTKSADLKPHVEPWVGLGMAGVSGRF